MIRVIVDDIGSENIAPYMLNYLRGIERIRVFLGSQSAWLYIQSLLLCMQM